VFRDTQLVVSTLSLFLSHRTGCPSRRLVQDIKLAVPRLYSFRPKQQRARDTSHTRSDTHTRQANILTRRGQIERRRPTCLYNPFDKGFHLSSYADSHISERLKRFVTTDDQQLHVSHPSTFLTCPGHCGLWDFLRIWAGIFCFHCNSLLLLVVSSSPSLLHASKLC
jgi:hypothetical protein